MRNIFKLGQKWSDDGGENAYWVEVHPHARGVLEDTRTLGGEFRTLEELERVAKALHADLDRVMEQARRKLDKRV